MRIPWWLCVGAAVAADAAAVNGLLRRADYIPEKKRSIQTEPDVSPEPVQPPGPPPVPENERPGRGRVQPTWAQAERQPVPAREEQGGESASKAIAFLLFMGIAIIACVFAMTQTAAASVSANTILVVDNITSIFLAVLWFQGIDDLTNMLPEGHHQVMAALFHAVVLLSAAFLISLVLKRNANGLAWFCGCAAHYCAFASLHAGSEAQEHHFSWSLWACFGGLLAIFAVLLSVYAVLYMAKRAVGIKPGVESEDESENRFVDRFDDVETDFGGVCMAAYWTVVVRYTIVGRYPESDEIEPGEQVDHNTVDRNLMLLYVFIMAILAIGFIMLKSKIASPSYAVSRVLGLVQSFSCLSVAFGFLFWGKMYFFEQPAYNVIPLLARIYFAGICSAIAMVGIFALAGLKLPVGSSALGVGLATFGLIAGVAWEEVFDASIEAEVEGTAHEETAKLLFAVLASAVILPVHGIYLKPLALKAEEAEEDSDK